MVGQASASSVGFAPPNDTITSPPALRIARTSDWIVVPFASRSRPIGPMPPQAGAQTASRLAFTAPHHERQCRNVEAGLAPVRQQFLCLGQAHVDLVQLRATSCASG